MGATTFTRGSRGKIRLPSGDGVDVAGKFEIAQVFQKIFVKYFQTAQIVDVVRVKMQILDVVDDLR